MRWHGKRRRSWYNYHSSIDELKPWVPKVGKVAEKTKTTCEYFNNHHHGYAVENCLQVVSYGSSEKNCLYAILSLPSFCF